MIMALSPPTQEGSHKDDGVHNSTITDIPQAAREILEKYSNIPSKDVIPHVTRIVCSSTLSALLAGRMR